MPRYQFPAGTVTNTTGNPLVLRFYRTQAGTRPLRDFMTVDGFGYEADPIPNGVLLAAAGTGAYSGFAGPDDISELWVEAGVGGARTQLSSNTTVTEAGGANLSTTYARLRAGGNRVVWWGDSITAGGCDAANGIWADTIGMYATLQTNGIVQAVWNAGVAGETSAQILARFATSVLPSNPNAVVICAGANDVASSLPLSKTAANIEAMVALCRPYGILPIIATIPPRGRVGDSAPAAGQVLATQTINQWIRRYCQSNNIPCLDQEQFLTDPATGYYPTAYSADGVHPNAVGSRVCGLGVGPTLASIMAPGAGPYRAFSNVDPSSLVPNGLLMTNNGTLPTPGWSQSGAGTATVTTGTVTGFTGAALTVAVTGAGGKSIGGVGVATSGLAGHLLQVSFKVVTSGCEAAGQVFQVGFRTPGTTPSWITVMNMGGDTTTPYVWVGEGVMGAGGAGYMQIQINTNNSATAGTLSLGEIAITDLTALGVAALTP